MTQLETVKKWWKKAAQYDLTFPGQASLCGHALVQRKPFTTTALRVRRLPVRHRTKRPDHSHDGSRRISLATTAGLTELDINALRTHLIAPGCKSGFASLAGLSVEWHAACVCVCVCQSSSLTSRRQRRIPRCETIPQWDLQAQCGRLTQTQLSTLVCDHDGAVAAARAALHVKVSEQQAQRAALGHPQPPAAPGVTGVSARVVLRGQRARLGALHRVSAAIAWDTAESVRGERGGDGLDSSCGSMSDLNGVCLHEWVQTDLVFVFPTTKATSK